VSRPLPIQLLGEAVKYRTWDRKGVLSQRGGGGPPRQAFGGAQEELKDVARGTNQGGVLV